MKVALSLTSYEESFKLPHPINFNMMRLISASIYNVNMIGDEQPLYINVSNMEQNYDLNSKKYYSTILFPHSVDSWYIFSRDLDNYDYQNDETRLINEITIKIDYMTGSLGSNKINLEFEFL